MMAFPLTLTSMFRRGIDLFPRKEIVSRRASGEVVRHSYRQFGERTARLAGALARLGVARGERVGTMAWNHHRHLEAYFAVPCSGAVLHTLNLRLFPDQLVYIINHAEDRVLLIDEDLVPIVEAIADRLVSVRQYVIMADGALPATTLSPVWSYEELLTEADPHFDWPEDIEETAPAAMCYTSATTGNPKGVTYTHRSQYLHSMAIGLADSLGLCEPDVVLPFVPMFHANAWGLPHAAIWFGATLVLPGPRPDARAVLELTQRERVTVLAGVPTIWIACVPLLERREHDLSSVRAITCGGSAIPPALIEKYDSYGLLFVQAYGMTETSPLASSCRLKSYLSDLPPDQSVAIRAKQGIPMPGVEIRLVDDAGNLTPRDGKSYGEVLMRGPWIADEYYHDERSAQQFRDGWLYSGDIATWDEEGYIQIVDRTKDLVKSGGEWISSVELENAIMAIPGVAEATVIGVPHPIWQERPLACVVATLAHRESLTAEHILTPLRANFAKWWIPDAVVFLDEVPKTSVGKFSKRTLRERYAGYYQEAPALERV
ncbi:MAG TPA: long-chain fatty acid--CoA ligase [Chloroflexota bacterium]|nr:long-chain fatty acid--CoA ligase [Chloroflexota bacterium]